MTFSLFSILERLAGIHVQWSPYDKSPNTAMPNLFKLVGAWQCWLVRVPAIRAACDASKEDWQGRQDSNPRPAVLEFENENEPP